MHSQVPFSRISFIINPAAGQKAPVDRYIYELFSGSGLQWHVHTLQPNESAADVIRRQGANFDLFAIYGGDGSVTEAATALIGGGVPLAIVPGGTANVLAKEFGIPQDTEAALKLIRDGQYQLKKIDTGKVNGRPFLLRINLGIMAEMITDTDPELKEEIGQLAYGVATVKTIREAELVDYTLEIDGEKVNVPGVSLTVTNSGNVGIGSLQLYPGIRMNDGLLDVLVLKDAGFPSLLKAVGASLFEQETDVFFHRACRKVRIRMPEEQTYLCDDCQDKAKTLTIEVVPSSLHLIVPANGD